MMGNYEERRRLAMAAPPFTLQWQWRVASGVDGVRKASANGRVRWWRTTKMDEQSYARLAMGDDNTSAAVEWPW